MNIDNLGFWGLIHLALVIFALISIFSSNKSLAMKIVWTIVVAAFPIVGLIIYLIFGR